jgi:hypothetical protein
MITILFIRPLTLAYEGGSVAARSTEKFGRLRRTKYMTLAGSTLVVGSSTLLYINALLNLALGGVWWENPWLNVVVFGMNMDSILNGIGMLVVSFANSKCTLLNKARAFTMGGHKIAAGLPNDPSPLHIGLSSSSPIELPSPLHIGLSSSSPIELSSSSSPRQTITTTGSASSSNAYDGAYEHAVVVLQNPMPLSSGQ